MFNALGEYLCPRCGKPRNRRRTFAQQCQQPQAGNLFNVGSDGKFRISSGGKFEIGGSGDGCCCGSGPFYPPECTPCDNPPTSLNVTLSGMDEVESCEGIGTYSGVPCYYGTSGPYCTNVSANGTYSLGFVSGSTTPSYFGSFTVPSVATIFSCTVDTDCGTCCCDVEIASCSGVAIVGFLTNVQITCSFGCVENDSTSVAFELFVELWDNTLAMGAVQTLFEKADFVDVTNFCPDGFGPVNLGTYSTTGGKVPQGVCHAAISF